MAANLSRDQRAEVERLAWDLKATGRYTQDGIAAEVAARLGLDLDRSTVSRALKRTRTQVQKALAERAEQEALQQLDQLEFVQAEAMTEWERSKQDSRETIRTISSPSDDEDTSSGFSETTKTAGRIGDPRLLQRAMEAMEARRRILGVDAPSRSELSGPNGGPIEVEDATLTDEQRAKKLLGILERVRQRAESAPRDDSDA